MVEPKTNWVTSFKQKQFKNIYIWKEMLIWNELTILLEIFFSIYV